MSEDTSTTALVIELDKECEPLLYLRCDRVRPEELSLVIMPEEAHELTWLAREVLTRLDGELQGGRIDQLSVDSSCYMCSDLLSIYEWNEVSLGHTTLWTSPIIWNIRELCSCRYPIFLISEDWIIDISTWDTEPFLSFWIGFWCTFFDKGKTLPFE